MAGIAFSIRLWSVYKLDSIAACPQENPARGSYWKIHLH